MNFENAIVTADDDDVWTKASVIWAGETLQVLVPYESGGVEIVATFSGVDQYGINGRRNVFTSSTEMVNQFGDVYTEIVVVPQEAGCGSCGHRR